MANTNNIPTGSLAYRIVGCSIDEFAILDKDHKFVDGKFTFNSDLNIKFDPTRCFLACTCSIDCLSDANHVFISTFSMEFEINKNSLHNYEKDGQVTLPQNFLTHLLSTTYSALRGVIIAKLDSYPKRIILPPIDLNKIVNSPIQFKLPTP